MDDLITFWRARLDAAEQAAQAATPGPWRVSRVDGIPVVDSAGPYLVAEMYADPDPAHAGKARADAAHIAANDPASVLADITADRAIIAALGDASKADPGIYDAGRLEALEQVARIRVAKFASHPEYRPEFAP